MGSIYILWNLRWIIKLLLRNRNITKGSTKGNSEIDFQGHSPSLPLSNKSHKFPVII